ncbi:MAG: transposase [Planctomycetota bacterium]
MANPRKVQLIARSDRKSDRTEAGSLARIRARDVLVRARTKLVNHVRGAVKSMGARLRKVSAASFHKLDLELLPEVLRPALSPVLQTIGQLTMQIRQYDRDLAKLAMERHPEAAVLQQVPGVGPWTALTFLQILEDPRRFPKSRTAGAFLGLRPRQRDSGAEHPQLRITKAGDVLLRQLLAARGGGNAKKRAVVAVARRLAVLLHRLWVAGGGLRAAAPGPATGCLRPACPGSLLRKAP